MKLKFKNIFLLIIVLISFSAQASEDDHGHKEHAKENHKADHEEHQENTAVFQMSAKAISVLSIKAEKLTSLKKHTYEIPSGALLVYGEEKGVYKKTDNQFELIEVSVLKKSKDTYVIKSSNLKSNDQIVINGLPLLRVTHLQASGQGGEAHAH
jgi:hypothetical protein